MGNAGSEIARHTVLSAQSCEQVDGGHRALAGVKRRAGLQSFLETLGAGAGLGNEGGLGSGLLAAAANKDDGAVVVWLGELVN
jgi:hypothetical protein